jgi:hypothetical protein
LAEGAERRSLLVDRLEHVDARGTSCRADRTRDPHENRDREEDE